MKKTAAQLVEEATSAITTLSPKDAAARMEAGTATLVDVRDIRELHREGTIPGSVHAPRGMLEFWVDPESPYHREVFAAEGQEYIFFCASAWRSALATRDLQEMGFAPVAHIEGGFNAWREAGLPVQGPRGDPN